MNLKEKPLDELRTTQTLLAEIKNQVNLNRDYIGTIKKEDCLIHVKDVDSDSTFFFTIKKSSINANGQVVFEFQRKPRSTMDLSEHSSGMTSDKVISNFKNWISIIEGYSHISLTDEDSFEKRYQEEFINDFELVDADADENPFNVSQQIYIDEYVKIIQSVLEANKDKYEVQELIEEAQIIREQLPASTKSKVVKSIGKLLAKIQMKGLELLKEVWSEAKKQAIKKIIEGSLENLPKLLDLFS